MILAPAVAAALLVASLQQPKWSGLAVAVLGGFLLGVAVRRALQAARRGGAAGDRPGSDGGGDPPWRRYLFRIGDFQGRLVLALLYFSVVTPFALVVRLGQDPLRLRPPTENRSTYWRNPGGGSGDGGPTRPY